MTDVGRQCKATTKRGARCRAYAVEGSDYCYMHDPAKAKERARARAKGGRARQGLTLTTGTHGPVAIDDMGDVVGVLEQAINDVLQLQNSIARARAVGYLAGQLVKALEFATLEERIEALETALKVRDV